MICISPWILFPANMLLTVTPAWTISGETDITGKRKSHSLRCKRLWSSRNCTNVCTAGYKSLWHRRERVHATEIKRQKQCNKKRWADIHFGKMWWMATVSRQQRFAYTSFRRLMVIHSGGLTNRRYRPVPRAHEGQGPTKMFVYVAMFYFLFTKYRHI